MNVSANDDTGRSLLNEFMDWSLRLKSPLNDALGKIKNCGDDKFH